MREPGVLSELIKAKRQGKAIAHKPRPRGENVVDLMDALKKSLKALRAQKREKAPCGRSQTPASQENGKGGRSTAQRKAG
jgi:DNA end-binding protein Ku